MIKFKSLITVLVLLLLSGTFAFADSHGGGHDVHGAGGVPDMVFKQLVNVLILAAIIFFAARKKVKALFQQRSEDFYRQAREAAERKKALEDQKADLERRLSELKVKKEQDIQTAEIESQQFLAAEKLRAQQEAAKLDRDSEETLRAEEQKLIEKLRQEALEMSMVATEQSLGNLGGEEKAKVNKQFQPRLEGARL